LVTIPNSFAHDRLRHRHPGCRITTTPSTNADNWLLEFKRTIEHGQLVMKQLTASGWRVAVVWECALRKLDIDTFVDAVATWLVGGLQHLEIGLPPAVGD
jgi:DNA mismatch endonuclease (patch repair protein)